jgi:hypothetical protein
MNKKIFACLIGLLALVALAYSPSLSEPQAFNKTIEVSGDGVVKATPDEACIMIAVVSEASTAKEAAEMNSENMTGVFNELKKAGIADIKTRHYSITPIYKFEEKEKKLIGYRATNLIEVLCKPEEAGKAIDAAIEGGANRIDSISFQLSEELREKAYSEALRKAVKNAKSKAEVVAEQMGIASIHPVRISVEEYWRYPTPTPTPMIVREAVPTPITPSEVEVRASVRIAYAF